MASIDEKLLNVLSDVSQRVNNPFKDKWISILGDSISTYEGWMPEGNAKWYPGGDVNDVSKTWWHILLSKLGAKFAQYELHTLRNTKRKLKIRTVRATHIT